MKLRAKSITDLHKKNQAMAQDISMNEKKLGIKHYSPTEDMKFKQSENHTKINKPIV